MATRREIASEQLSLMNEIREKANINIVECGNCEQVLLHKRDSVDTIKCFSCLEDIDKSDCGDLWYNGCIDNLEFDED